MEIAPNLNSYQEEKNHSELVDAWLGLRIAEIEALVEAQVEAHKIETAAADLMGQEIWKKVPVSTMLTPYSELRRILECLRPKVGDLVVDLGAAYGRMGFVIEKYFPGVRFLGLELVAGRVHEAHRALSDFGAQFSRMELFDLFAEKPLIAPFYFIYDYGTDRAIHKTLGDLRDQKKEICVAARGRGVRDCIEKKHPWLGEVVAPEHFPHFSIYRNRID